MESNVPTPFRSSLRVQTVWMPLSNVKITLLCRPHILYCHERSFWLWWEIRSYLCSNTIQWVYKTLRPTTLTWESPRNKAWDTYWPKGTEMIWSFDNRNMVRIKYVSNCKFFDVPFIDVDVDDKPPIYKHENLTDERKIY